MKRLRNEAAAAAHRHGLNVVLDPAGEAITSEELASFLEKAGQDVTFFVGGAEGFSEEFRRKADRLLSLSKMTLPHELARIILVEQIYRAFTILRGHPYPR
jgi:23S rRNA (pseudouridine1915-N3)-methyltransferase